MKQRSDYKRDTGKRSQAVLTFLPRRGHVGTTVPLTLHAFSQLHVTPLFSMDRGRSSYNQERKHACPVASPPALHSVTGILRMPQLETAGPNVVLAK